MIFRNCMNHQIFEKIDTWAPAEIFVSAWDSLKNCPHNLTKVKIGPLPHMEKITPKGRKWTLYMHGEEGEQAPNRILFFFGGGGEGEHLYSCPTSAGPVRAPMSECDCKMHNIFGNYSSHNYIKIYFRVHPIDLCLENSLGTAYPQIL